jgi:hypothetical protein
MSTQPLFGVRSDCFFAMVFRKGMSGAFDLLNGNATIAIGLWLKMPNIVERT